MFGWKATSSAPPFQSADHAVVMFQKGIVTGVWCIADMDEGMAGVHSSQHPDSRPTAQALLLLMCGASITNKMPKAKFLALVSLLEAQYIKETEGLDLGDLPF